jgi:cell division septation protein DedD
MDPGLKQRLVGAAVLVALAVIFLPMLVKGPAPDSGVSDLSLTMPPAPAGEYVTRDLPLVTPEASSPTALGGDRLPTVDTANPPVSAPMPLGEAPPPTAAELPAPEPAASRTRLPASVAGGNHAVSFGAYATRDNARVVVARLRAAGLPGYEEPTTAGGNPAWRVRIGPYASRADAEAARVAAVAVRGDLDARVLVLDAEPVAAAAKAQAEAAPPKPATEATAAAPAAKPVVPVAPAAAADVGFVVQVGAFSRAEDATALRDRIRAAGFKALTESVETQQGTLTRVKAGPVLSRADADQLKAQLQAKLGLDGMVRSHP